MEWRTFLLFTIFFILLSSAVILFTVPSQQHIYYLHIVYNCHSMINLFSVYTIHFIFIIISPSILFFLFAVPLWRLPCRCDGRRDRTHILFATETIAIPWLLVIYFPVYNIHFIFIIIRCQFCLPCLCDGRRAVVTAAVQLWQRRPWQKQMERQIKMER